MPLIQEQKEVTKAKDGKSGLVSKAKEKFVTLHWKGHKEDGEWFKNCAVGTHKNFNSIRKGVPLSCWNAEFFSCLGRKFGDPLFIEEDTILKRRVDRGQMLMSLPLDKACPDKIKIIFNGKVMFVTVVEDPNSISMAWIEDFMDLRSLLSNSNPLPDSVVKGSIKAQVDGVSKSGKGSWIKKARVKTVAIYDKTARIDLDKRLSEACGKEISKSEFSTSSESDLHMWKGEYSRRCFSGGLQSSSLDQILKAHSKSPYNGQDSKGAGLPDGCRPSNVEMNCSKDLGSQFLCLSSNSSPNKEDCPSEEEGSGEEGECENWEIQECDEGQMVVVQRKSDKDEGLFQNRIQKILLLVSV
ncbi:hypothetical protein Q3G72_034933 [Acer saccharum]|nr:hypothetical protein Q3G72_034933 [Acer saccharum]